MLPARREVWLVDFGLAQKVRPALVVSVPYSDNDRAIISVMPHTTSTRGSQWEVPVQTRFLKAGAFLTQGITNIDRHIARRYLGVLNEDQMRPIEESLRRWLAL